MANLNQVQCTITQILGLLEEQRALLNPFAPERWVHSRFIFLPRTIDNTFSVRREEMHRMADEFEDWAFTLSGGSETTSACGDTYFCALLGA